MFFDVHRARLREINTDACANLLRMGSFRGVHGRGFPIIRLEPLDTPGALGSACLRDLMPVMKMLDALFQSNGDEESDDDGRTMNEEGLSGTNPLVRRMNIVHGRRDLRGGCGLRRHRDSLP